MKLTVEPEIVQTGLLAGSIVNFTGFFEAPPAATTVYVGPPTVAGLGGADVNVIVCAPLPTASDCCAWGAGAYSEFPAWLASIVHVPMPTKLTVEPEIVQTELLAGSTVNVTGFFDSPPVATTV
jgi:hypothetical protein